MGDDRSGMKMNLLMTGEEDLPRVATAINIGLRPRQIWNVLVVTIVMSSLDRGNDGPAMVGLDREDDGVVVFFVGVVHQRRASTDSGSMVVATGGVCWWRRATLVAVGGIGGGHWRQQLELRRQPWLPPIRVGDGARKVHHDIGRGRTLPSARIDGWREYELDLRSLIVDHLDLRCLDE
ncbi:hypothetical protein ACLOJK_037549 [Asimina triloba]